VAAIPDAITALIAEAEHEYRSALGGETACTIHRDGRVTGGMTYHEGRLIALREARRVLEVSDTAAWHTEISGLRDRWAADLELRRASRIDTPPWIAYATGGYDAAAEALAAIETES
jgi:hypothetical protein